MNEKILKQFIDSFTTKENASLIESIHTGYSCIFEGYADVRDIETEDAVTMFNRQAAYNSSYGSNPVLSFLQRSSEMLQNKYTEDPNPELDSIRTTIHYEPTDGMQSYDNDLYENYYETQANDEDYDNGFGLTSRDLKDLG